MTELSADPPPPAWLPQPCRNLGRFRRFVADESHSPVLVSALRHWMPELAWSKVRGLIEGRRVAIGGALCLDEGRKLGPGEWVDVFEAPLPAPPTSADVQLVHLDLDVVVVEKPARMLTLRHPAEAHWPARRKQLQPTLKEAIVPLLPGREKHSLFSVHRIDRDTSGLLVFARNEPTQRALIQQFAAHDVVRSYHVIVPGVVPRQTVRSFLVRDRGDGLRGSSLTDESVPAVSHFEPLRRLRADAAADAAVYQELLCTLETGRTHQIRIHLAELGHPVCGDWMYRNRFGAPPVPDVSDAPRLALHASGLGFQHPTSGNVLRFESSWPVEMQRWIARLQGAPHPRANVHRANQGALPRLARAMRMVVSEPAALLVRNDNATLASPEARLHDIGNPRAEKRMKPDRGRKPKSHSGPRRRSHSGQPRRELGPGPSGPWMTQQISSLALDPAASIPAVYVRSRVAHPLLFRKRIARVERARPGDFVAVYGDGDTLIGYGLYNSHSELALRMLWFEPQLPDEQAWDEKLRTAVDLRRKTLSLDKEADAYRVVHGEADGLSGIVIDKFADVLSAEAFGLGMYQRAQAILQRLAPMCDARHTLVQTSPAFASQEGCDPPILTSDGFPASVIIQEHGVRFKVRFEGGHKTGFFCDQRENRKRLADFCQGKSVLDLCCYTGGFAVYAKKVGGAEEVVGVDLDESPLVLARENANLNQCRVRFVQADAFPYMREMIQNGRTFDVVILDPPKLIRTRAEIEEGTKKHFALNRLAMRLVKPGGLLLSCSCAGLLPEPEFTQLLVAASRQSGPELPASGAEAAPRYAPRTMQFLAKTGAAPDHPVAANCLETEYLKAAWMILQ